MVVVTLGQAFVINVEGIAVLHQEFASTEKTGAGASLVSVLGLDLIERHRKVFVTAVEVLHEKGEHLFVGGAEKEIGTFTVL